ncbi:MAG: apolipoprotein N-acyltransferase [Planctomycetota bacterium]|nr:apolipoprotein N-acyltransferase [Planctomycetota bacterium]
MLRRLLLLGLALGLAVLWLPPGPLPPLVLVGDVPFLALLFLDGGRHWKRWTLLYGILYLLAASWWLSYITPAHPVGAALVSGPTWLFFGGAIRWFARRRVFLPVAVGLAAVGEEMLRTVWMGGFPWPQRALAFASDAPFDGGLSAFLPAAGFFGAWTFSFVAGLASGAVYCALVAVPRDRRALVRATATLTLAFGLLAALTAARGDDVVGEPTTRELLVVQAVIPQSLKHGGPEESKRMFDEHVRLSAFGVRRLGADRLLGVLWPETMTPWPLLDAEVAARFPEAWEDEVGVLRRLHDDAPLARNLPWFIGAIHHFRRGEERRIRLWDYGDHDSLLWLDAAQAPPPGSVTPAQPAVGTEAPWRRGRHDKVNLVPGGEYTPGAQFLPALEWFRRQISPFPALDAGALEQEPWAVPDGEGGTVAVGSAVCYDIAFPRACRAWRRQGAEVILNPGNYGWFGPTAFRSQLAAMARLRAAELAVTVVVAGNTGPTGFYDPLGRPYGRFQPEDEPADEAAGTVASTYRAGFAHAPLYRPGAATVYSRLGDLGWAVAGLAFLAVALGCGRRSQRANSA